MNTKIKKNKNFLTTAETYWQEPGMHHNNEGSNL